MPEAPAPEASAERDELELLASDFMERLRRGESPSVTAYAAAHPELAAEIRDLFPVIAAAEQVKTQRLAGSRTALRSLPLAETNRPAPPEPAGAPPPPPRAGLILGKYPLLERIGQGCLGTVWRSAHPELGIPLAVKVLRPELLGRNAAQVQRFLREARTAAQLNHPHVVRVFDAGCDQGLYFMVMELVEGGSVGELLRQAGGKLGTVRAVEIVTAVATALQAAAEAGIVHRDVKPDNILLDRKGTPKLADLGLAKPLTAAEQPELTGAGVSLGTPLYVAPEQALGDGASDARADIYSLGATLYHLVTGVPPFTGTTAYQIVHRHVHDPVVDPREHNPEISAELARILLRMLAKDPRDRYASAPELVAELSRLAGGGQAVVPWPPRRRHGWRRWRLPLAVAAAAAVGGGLLVWALRWPSPVAPPSPAAAAAAAAAGPRVAGPRVATDAPPPRPLARAPRAPAGMSAADWRQFDGPPRPDAVAVPLDPQDYELVDGVLRVTARPGPEPATLVYAPPLPAGPLTLLLEARNLGECGFLDLPGGGGGCRIVLRDPAAAPPPPEAWQTIEIRRDRNGLRCTVNGRPAAKIERPQATRGAFLIPLPRSGSCELRRFTVAPAPP